MITLQTLDLTEKDFDLIISGLDHLPHKNDAGEIFSDLMISVMGDKLSKGAAEELEKKRAEKYRKLKEEQRDMIDDIRILQGKLLLLKRYLKQEHALKEANDIINPS